MVMGMKTCALQMGNVAVDIATTMAIVMNDGCRRTLFKNKVTCVAWSTDVPEQQTDENCLLWNLSN